MYSLLKESINGLLGVFGLRLIRVTAPEAVLDPSQRSIARGLSTREHNTRENMDAIYSDANVMVHYFTSQRLAFYHLVCEQLARLALQPADVLDVGCGSGHLLAEMKKIFPAAGLKGVDFSPESIRLARKLNPGVDFGVMSIFDVEQLQRQFDLILCTEVIEHLEEADRAVDKLVAVCRQGGTIVITTPHGRHDTFAGHFNFWTPESFCREFRALKPEVEEIESFLFIVIRRN